MMRDCVERETKLEKMNANDADADGMEGKSCNDEGGRHG